MITPEIINNMAIIASVIFIICVFALSDSECD